MNALNKLKRRMSTINQESWHYRLTSKVYGTENSPYKPKKACAYWWLAVPTSPFVALLLAVVVVMFAVVFVSVFSLMSGIAIFFGFWPKKILAPSPEDNHGYKRRPTLIGNSKRQVRRVRVAPWEVAVVVLALSLPFWAFDISDIGESYYLWILRIFGVLGILWVAGLAAQKHFLPWLVKKYNRHCPDIVWEDA